MRLLAGLLVLVVVSAGASAHPGDGIVVTADDAVLFVDVARRVIWRVDADGALAAVQRERWTHGLYLAADGAVYYDREVQRGDVVARSLWRIGLDGRHRRVVEPQVDGRVFEGAPFVWTTTEPSTTPTTRAAGVARC